MFNKIGLSKIGAGITPYPVYSEGIKACTGQFNIKKLKEFAAYYQKCADRK